MPFVAKSEVPPLQEDNAGALRVGETRVLLELVIRAFQDGATPEAIAQRYDTLMLSDVYAVIAYYLRHRSDVEEYLASREHQGNENQQQFATSQRPVIDVRERLLARNPT